MGALPGPDHCELLPSRLRPRTATPKAEGPASADEDRIRASYDRGVLEVVVNLKDHEAVQADKRIPVRTKMHTKPT
jgi:HSP20 family molecular chaperone IbpA